MMMMLECECHEREMISGDNGDYISLPSASPMRVLEYMAWMGGCVEEVDKV